MTLLISRVMKYLEDHDAAPSMICRVYLRYIEHIYYKVCERELEFPFFQTRCTEFEDNLLWEKGVVCWGMGGSNERGNYQLRDLLESVCNPIPTQLDMVRVKEIIEERKLNKISDEEEVSVEQAAASTASQMERMCQFIYSKDDSNRIRTRAMLCHVYFLALHDRWYEARDLMLMSHLQENIGHSDIPTQVSGY